MIHNDGVAQEYQEVEAVSSDNGSQQRVMEEEYESQGVMEEDAPGRIKYSYK